MHILSVTGRRRAPIAFALLWTLLAGFPMQGHADTDAVADVKQARNGGGLRIGGWDVRGLSAPANGDASEGIAFSGSFEKGLDLHLSWENTIGFWSRRQTATEPGTLGETRYEWNTYLVPSTTSLKLHPLTRPGAPVEPYVRGGAGLVMGIDQERRSGDDPIVPPGTSMRFSTGFTAEIGSGVDWRPSGPFGFNAQAGYRWISFGESVGGEARYEGWAFEGGLTYRFQYR